MKYGHVEASLRPAMPPSWGDQVRNRMATTPDVVIVLGAGVVVAICTVVALFVRRADENKKEPAERERKE